MAVFARILGDIRPPASHSTLEIQFVDGNDNPVNIDGASSATTTTPGLVRQAASVPDNADMAALCAALRAAGIMAPKA